MNLMIFRRMAPALLTLTGLVASTNLQAANINIATLLANAGFENGLKPTAPGDFVGSPAGWFSQGSPSPGSTAYLVTSAQYTAGADGLASGIVPGGLYAGQCPAVIEGSCSLYNLGLGTYVAGNTYTLDLWVGTPMTVPYCGNTPGCVANVTPVGKVATLRFYWLGNSNGQLAAQDIPAPAVGQWTLVHLSFTPTGIAVGQQISVMLFVDSGGNNQLVNFDVATPCTCP